MVREATRSMWLSSIVVYALYFLIFAEILLSGEPKTPVKIAPDPKIQATIALVVTSKGDEDKEAKEALKILDNIALRTPQLLAPQLVYYSLHVTNEKEAWSTFGVMSRFGKRWDSEMRRSLIPLLEINDRKTHKEVARWLFNIDGFGRIDPEVNVLSYREALIGQKKAPPPGLVNYVYDHAPGKALLLLGEIYSDNPKFGDYPRDLVWSDHVITTVKWRLLNRFLQEGDLEKAQKELDTLSKHKGWYARRYVVETMRHIPKLGTPEIAERLRKDANPLVADPAKFIE